MLKQSILHFFRNEILTGFFSNFGFMISQPVGGGSSGLNRIRRTRESFIFYTKLFRCKNVLFLRGRSRVSNSVLMSVNTFQQWFGYPQSVCKQNALLKLDWVLRVFSSRCKRKGGIKSGAKPCPRKIEFIENPIKIWIVQF